MVVGKWEEKGPPSSTTLLPTHTHAYAHTQLKTPLLLTSFASSYLFSAPFSSEMSPTNSPRLRTALPPLDIHRKSSIVCTIPLLADTQHHQPQKPSSENLLPYMLLDLETRSRGVREGSWEQEACAGSPRACLHYGDYGAIVKSA